MTKTKTTDQPLTTFGRFAKNKFTKPFFGFAILIGYVVLMLVMGTEKIFEGSKPMKIAMNGVMGLIMGYVLQRSFFGFAGTSVRTGKGNAKLAYAVLAMFAIVAVVVALIAGSEVGSGKSFFGLAMTKHARPIGLGTALGAIIFGIGMVMAKACASGSLTDFGSSGIVRVSIVLVFFVIGAGPGQMIQNDMNGGSLGTGKGVMHTLPVYLSGTTGATPSADLITPWGLFGAVLLTLTFIATMALVAYLVAKKIRLNRNLKQTDLEIMMGETEDTFTQWLEENNMKLQNDEKRFFSKDTFKKLYFNLFAKKMSLWLGALAFGGLMIAAIVINGKGWGVTTSFSNMMGWVTGEDSMIKHHKSGANVTILEDGGTWRNLGLLLGALAYMLTSYKAKYISDWYGFKNKKTWIGFGTAALAGFFLGFGARMADGCNAGQWATGLTTFSLSGWVFGIFMTGGAALAIATPFIYKRLRNK